MLNGSRNSISQKLSVKDQENVNHAVVVDLPKTFPAGSRTGIKILVVFTTSCAECRSDEEAETALENKVVDATTAAMQKADAGFSSPITGAKKSLSDLLGKLGASKGAKNQVLILHVSCTDCCPKIISGQLAHENDTSADEEELNNIENKVVFNMDWSEINNLISC
jgi:hypothetical protein